METDPSSTWVGRSFCEVETPDRAICCRDQEFGSLVVQIYCRDREFDIKKKTTFISSISVSVM